MVKSKKRTTGTSSLDIQRKHQEDLERIRRFRLMDDTFMSKVFEDKKCAELLLHIILDRNDLIVQEVHGQYDINNLQGRSIRLDILAVDGTGKVYNVEVQRSNGGAVPKRARYNSSLLDANVTEPGDDYEKLCESYVIFITENDVLKSDLPIYHIDRIVRETGEYFGDDAHIVYVNAKIKDNSALGKLMHDFFCKDSRDMDYKVFADRVHYFKRDQKGVMTMCKAMEDMRKEERMEAEYEAHLATAKILLKQGVLSYEQISEATKLSINDIKSLKEN